MKREGQKMRLFALKELLERETDDKHSITMDRILQLLQTKYDMKAERKSIYYSNKRTLVVIFGYLMRDFQISDAVLQNAVFSML